MTSEQAQFRDLLKLVGKEVELSLRTTGEKLRGKIVYDMFDSFLFEANQTRRVIRVTDLLYLDRVD